MGDDSNGDNGGDDSNGDNGGDDSNGDNGGGDSNGDNGGDDSNGDNEVMIVTVVMGVMICYTTSSQQQRGQSQGVQFV